jgi:hypothetical protein
VSRGLNLSLMPHGCCQVPGAERRRTRRRDSLIGSSESLGASSPGVACLAAGGAERSVWGAYDMRNLQLPGSQRRG